MKTSTLPNIKIQTIPFMSNHDHNDAVQFNLIGCNRAFPLLTPQAHSARLAYLPHIRLWS